MKRSLRKVLGNARLTFDELLTVLIETELSLNTRPLTYDYDEVNGEVLTSSHLIYGRPINSLPDTVVEGDPEEISSGEKYKYVTTF